MSSHLRGCVVSGLVLGLVTTLAACGDDSTGSGGSGGAGSGATSASGTGGSTTSGLTTTNASGSGGGDGGAGSGGGPDLDKDPAEVTSADECFYEGEGGQNAWTCAAVRVDFDAPVPAAGLAVLLETSEGDTFETPFEQTAGFYAILDEGDPVAGLSILVDSPPPHYDPSWVDIEVRSDGVLVGAERFEGLEYTCSALSSDDWCWESAPVTLPISAPE